MVVAVLVNRFAPSSRGLKRASPSQISLNASGSQTENEPSCRILQDVVPGSTGQKKMIGHRRKPFRAMALLTSIASDLDVVSDWFFYYETYQNDRNYRSMHRDGVYLIPPFLLAMVLFCCIMGTAMWFVLATDGKIVTPLLRRLGFDKLSMGFLLFLAVILEDIPQVVLTFLVEDYYEQDQFISNFAVWNVTSSLYDTLIKIAEAYDERHDIVETGAWCKHSVNAHTDIVTAVVTLSSDTSLRSSYLSRKTAGSATDLLVPLPSTALPRLQFLTSSLDKSIRLWNCNESQVVQGVHETTCANEFLGHLGGVTCLTMFEPGSGWKYNNVKGPFFFSGCQNGTINLWSSNSVVCLRRYIAHDLYVTSVAVLNASFMVAGYSNGTCRLWDISSGGCLVVYRGHQGHVASVCSMEDGTTFVSASHDKTLRLWDVSAVIQNPRFPRTGSHDIKDDDSDSMAQASDKSAENSISPESLTRKDSHMELLRQGTTGSSGTALVVPSSSSTIAVTQTRSRLDSNPPLEITNSERTFSGHSKAVLCVACMEAGSIFASGSKDRKVRLWSASTGSCLNIITGHEGAITAIAPMDGITLLTGSDDKSIKAWDCMSANCLRTYTGHNGTVTSISVVDDSFVTTSEDGTAKLWVVTVVEDRPVSFDLLDVNDGLCKGFDPS